MENNNVCIVSIEGNIGSGKSTLLANLREKYGEHANIVFLKEPVDEWAKIKDENGVTILEKFYADQEKYSFSFQMMAYVSRLKMLRNEIKKLQSNTAVKTIIITERSLYTDKMVFAQMLHDHKKIEYINYQIYLSWFDAFIDEFPVHKVIYVKTDPAICYARIHKRSREGEEQIPLAYLTDCGKYHDSMLDTSKKTCMCNNQFLMNGNVDIYENPAHVTELLNDIDVYIHK